MFDFANSGYTTVVLTAVFNAYFVAHVAGAMDSGAATLLWTLAVGAANAAVLLTAPIVGAYADARAAKKRMLAWTTAICGCATALLATVGPGDVVLGFVLIVVSAFAFGTGEDLIAAFLPEIATRENMGRISGYGWALGYVGGLATLLATLVWIRAGEAAGRTGAESVPTAMLIVAGVYVAAALPTFLWLQERAQPVGESGVSAVAGARQALARLVQTIRAAHEFQDLFRLLASITVYAAGVNTVVVLAAVYAQQVLGFTTQETLLLILVVNVAAAVGAFAFGHLQDRFGSVRTLSFTLLLWIAALIGAVLGETNLEFWVVGHTMGFAMGGSQSAGRALVGQFAPAGRQGEFFGLWGLAMKLSGVLGPPTYGLVAWASGGQHRLGLLATMAFFVVGLVILSGVDEARGRAAALQVIPED
ncbi:MAG: UMF1 family MFS transporter [Hyphomicrobiaceae bacterium]|jgi:UMF1 family MFS transporter